MVEQLRELIKLCHCSLSMEINDHKTCYKSTEQAIEELRKEGGLTDCTEHQIEQMIENDTVVRLQIFPYSPVGHYTIYSHDIGHAIGRALCQLMPADPDRLEDGTFIRA